MTKKRRSFFFLLGALLNIAVLVAACAHPLWKIRSAQLTGDFLSHTFYLSFCLFGAGKLVWIGIRNGDKYLYWWPPVTGLVTFICVESLKRATRLPRPDGEPTGFPSGHTTLSFAVAGLLSQVSPRFAVLWYAAAISISWSRIEGHAHFPYQVLAGAVIGTGISWGIGHFSREGKK